MLERAGFVWLNEKRFAWRTRNLAHSRLTSQINAMLFWTQTERFTQGVMYTQNAI
jgi:hypothetical protein